MTPVSVGGITPTASIGLTPTNAAAVSFGTNTNSRSALQVTSTTSHAFSGAIGSFVIPPDALVNALSTMRAQINWGDRTNATAGTVVSNSDGTFTVNGSHAFLRAGTFAVTATVSVPTANGVAAFNTTVTRQVTVR